MRGVTCVVVMVLSAGCGPLAAQTPQLGVSPEVVYFPAAAEGGEVSVPLTVYNLGDAPLEVCRLQLGVSTGYQLSTPTLPRHLAAGEAMQVRLAYRPGPGAPSTNVVEIESDDPGQRWTRVAMAGLTAAPVLTAAPPLVDFGAVPSGGVEERRIHVRNIGLATARGVGLDWVEPHPDFSARLAEDTLAPSRVSEVVVSYGPRGGDADRALLRLRWEGGAELLALRGHQDLKAPD